MRARSVLLAVWLAAAAACGPSVSGDSPDAAVVVDPPDAAPPPPPLPDAAAPIVEMYAHTASLLYVIDDASFELRLIGDFGLGETDDITDVAVTPDGTLYGISTTKLYTIDTATAVATYVADVPGLSNVGLTFLPDGTLLATDKDGGVRRIDPGTGQITEVGEFGSGFATAGDLVAVADGTMYAISDEGPVGDEFDNNWLLIVDTSTGAATGVGQIGYGSVFGCAYANGHVFAFTRGGEIIEIDRVSGDGNLVRSYPVEFWGAGVTPLVVVE